MVSASGIDSFRLDKVLIGSLCKHDVEESENVICKYDFAFLQSFFDYLKSLCLKNVF